MTDRKHVLRGRTAVVTGAARGVGAAVARQLADRGASVALIGLEEESLARLAHELPTESYHWHVDVTDDELMARVAGEVREMSAYCASKAGVESFSQALRPELAPRGLAVGTAYLNWTDTDMIRDADQHAVLRELCAHMPSPARKVYPAEHVAVRLVDAVERRASSVYVPGWFRGAQAARAALPTLVSRIARRELTRSEFSATGLLGAGGRAAESRRTS
ncbi:SDR family NAD(P)-dependent oxidoreductase [Streptomyces niveus]